MKRLVADRNHKISFSLNGEPVEGEAEPRLLMVDFLRHHIGATGTHVGCEHGVCGACTVMVDGALTRSCLTFATQIDGCDVRTVEGLSPQAGRLGIIQAAFKRNHALQCGFCTAGILVSLDHFLNTRKSPTENQIRDLLSGHLCRCTGYTPIVRAALEAAHEIARSGSNGTDA